MTLCLDTKLNLSEISSLVDIIRYRAQYQPQKNCLYLFSRWRNRRKTPYLRGIISRSASDCQ